MMENVVFDNDKFIALVQNEESLWNKVCPEYSNRTAREDAWRKVLDGMYGEENVKTWSPAKLKESGKSKRSIILI